MREFCFTLEAVRTLRRRQEQVAVDEYVRRLLERQRATEAIAEVQRQLDTNRGELTRVLAEGCTAARAFQLNNYQRFLEKQREQRLVMLAQAEQRLGVSFQALLISRQQREVVEIYRKKQQARHQRMVLQEEQKFTDETAARRGASTLSWNPGGEMT
jgi:flagellar export protein FliJ